MDRSRVWRRATGRAQESLSQPSRRGRNNMISLSQPVASTSTYDSEEETDHIASQEENQLTSSIIKYLLVSERGKQIINRTRIIKNVLGGQGKHFHHLMKKVKNLLSKIFGYKLVELEGNKYILVNEIKNNLPHIRLSGSESAQQVLLFLVLTHIFMQEESCREDTLWDFLTNLGIITADNQHHDYFGNVKQLITEDFVAQKYLDKVFVENSDPPKVELKWGVRAEHEFSRRAALEFVCQIYNGRSMNSWPLQFKALNARERSDNS